MARKIAQFILLIFGVAAGPLLLMGVDEIFKAFGLLPPTLMLLPWAAILIYIVSGMTTGIIIYILSPRMIDAFVAVTRGLEKKLSDMPLPDILVGVAGLLVGLFVAFLISTLTWRIPTEWLSIPIGAVLYLVLGELGWKVAVSRKGEISLPFGQRRKDRGGKLPGMARPKVLDTSVIIDGRIFDICKTGVLEGALVVPGFVLQELRHIADSADALKRNRGRRGLDILNSMQKELDMTVRIEEKDYDDIAEVDAKLLRLAFDLGGVVVTNDYNLNKVASVQEVPVFNINELANAIKPVVLPGEEMQVVIIKEGKEQGQGVAYLEDGTMIVVDGAKRYVGDELGVVVTSVLQTSAGRMIFAKMK